MEIYRENNMKDKYTFGKCKNCNKNAALKNGYCSNCQDNKADLPPGFEDLFRGFDNKEDK